MSMYFYERSADWLYKEEEINMTNSSGFFDIVDLYSAKSLNSETGVVSLTNKASMASKYLTLYSYSESNYYQYKAVNPGIYITVYKGDYFSIDTEYQGAISRKEIKTIPYLLEGAEYETIIAKDGTYPNNGMQESYWYVKKELATVANILSPNGNETLNKLFEIKWEDTKLGLTYDIELSSNNGVSWKRIITGVSGNKYSYDFKDEVETSIGRLRIRANYPEGAGHWVINQGVFTIQHDFPPSKPNNLTPFAGESINGQEIQRLSWKHNHPNAQSKFDIEWSSDQIDWNRISRNTTTEFHNVEANTFTTGDIYWRVRTYSDVGLVSDWSNVAIFISAVPSDAPIITSSNIVTSARPIFSWSQGDQLSYEVQLLNSIGVVVWETGKVSSRNKAITSGIELVDGATYTLRVKTGTELDLWTEWATQTITVTYTSPPKPTFELIEGDGFVAINILNPAPSGLQPSLAYNDVYRDGVRIATRIGNNYKDFGAMSGVEHSYQVVAVAENKSVSKSDIKATSIDFEGVLLSTLNGLILKIEVIDKIDFTKNNLKSKMFFKGREKPVFQYSQFIDENIPLNFTLYRKKDLDLFEEIENQRGIILFRDEKGRKKYCIIDDYVISDNENTNEWFDVSLKFVIVDFNEVV